VRRRAEERLEVVLPALEELARAPRAGEVLDAVRLTGLDLAGADLPDLRLLEVELSGCRLDGARLPGARLSSVRLVDLAARALDAGGSSWREVVVEGGRLGVLGLAGATLQRVRASGARLHHVDARGARLHDVLLEDCTVGELDLTDAEGAHVVLRRCRVERLVLRGTDLAPPDGLDVTGADVAVLDALDDRRAPLRGLVLSAAQATDLAEVLARHLGARVVDPAPREGSGAG
jgi:uncharacterized protein YjbI with pentapeptide repeats